MVLQRCDVFEEQVQSQDGIFLRQSGRALNTSFALEGSSATPQVHGCDAAVYGIQEGHAHDGLGRSVQLAEVHLDYVPEAPEHGWTREINKTTQDDGG